MTHPKVPDWQAHWPRNQPYIRTLRAFEDAEALFHNGDRDGCVEAIGKILCDPTIPSYFHLRSCILFITIEDNWEDADFWRREAENVYKVILRREFQLKGKYAPRWLMDIRDELDQWAEQRRQDLMKSVFGGGEEEDDFDYEIKDEDGDEDDFDYEIKDEDGDVDEDMKDDSEEIHVKIEGFEQGDRTEDMEEDARNTQPPTTHRSPTRGPRTSTAAGTPLTFPSRFLGFGVRSTATSPAPSKVVNTPTGSVPRSNPFAVCGRGERKLWWCSKCQCLHRVVE
ncbi:hypothetical protein J4E83_009796 [Alternaria metachromatica]|uniref:uncharacterized protein n=1 Tax=Alternaria metachromatica TaxID=283354 RepID=UPI0020C297B2|nr:uncharacterized protein J4E83_009796 [Alternaria metachromatica]KAI4607041.1 hypothetical protein J4E83_009796 [Alternaria metachromatica]